MYMYCIQSAVHTPPAFVNSQVQEISVPNFPSNPNLGTHTVSFDRVIYIEQTDFREVSSGRRIDSTTNRV